MSAVLAETAHHDAWLEPLFDVAFAAPGGIARLRQLILTLAMQGKLVPQLSTEVPAAELLKQIAVEKAALVKGGKIRVSKPLEPIADSEKPYMIPASWKWVRLGDFGYFLGGKTPSTSNAAFWGGKIPWVSPKDMKSEIITTSEDMVTDVGQKSGLPLIPKRSVLIVVRSGILRRFLPVAVNAVNCTINQDLKALVPYLEGQGDFLALMLRSFQERILKKYTKQGVTVESVKFDELCEAPFPLPPLEEQKRIVARIDELMRRCDDLERLRQQLAEKRAAARAATVRQWLAGDEAAARLFGKHFATLVSTREDVAELRKAVLQLAVMGKLVAQDARDAPASELLKQIAAEKAALVKAGKIRTPKPLEPIADAEKPYAIPAGWEWVRFGELVEVLNGRAYKQNELLDKGTPVLRVGNLFTSKHWYYSNLELEDDKYIDRGDLIYAWSASFGPFVWDGQRVIYHYHIWKLRFFAEGSPDKRFLYNFLMDATEAIKSSGNGIAMLHMTKDRMEKLLVPLPSLAEQKRIVARIDELVQLCGMLEQNIDAAQAKQTELLDAVMARV